MSDRPGRTEPGPRNSLFLQSEMPDPYGHYAFMLREHPVYHDEANQLWAVHSYGACHRLLNAESAMVPPRDDLAGLSPGARDVIGNLVRLANPPAHGRVRPLVLRLFGLLQPPDARALMDRLLPVGRAQEPLDWIGSVATRLPALALLLGYGFSEPDTEFLLARAPQLTRLMKPTRSVEDAAAVDAVTADTYPLVERHIRDTPALASLAEAEGTVEDVEARYALLTANLLGLLIQGQDAGRGMLSNALVHLLEQVGTDAAARDPGLVRRAVVESLRYDPPVHNTRRVLARPVRLEGETLPAGANVLLVLGAANHDPAKFSHPDRFDPRRPNNDEHLTFGSGAHACLADRLMTGLVADALHELIRRYPRVRLVERDHRYEPLVNLRLPTSLHVALTG